MGAIQAVAARAEGLSARRVKPSVREAALAYLARGWSVIPIEPRGKRPVVPWLEYQRRLATPHEIEHWFQRWPDANVGVVTGALSGLVVLDVDPRHGGADSLARLEIDHAPLARTIEAATGGGGRHLYFAHPGGAVPNRIAIVPGIDVRGDGGCVVAPPSLHASGGRYAWVPSRSPDEASLALLPRWLLAAGREEGEARGHTLAHWRRLVHHGVDEGARNATLASLAGHLLWHGVDPEVVVELLHAWNRARCRPPLSDDEVLRCVESIVHAHGGGHAAWDRGHR
jgi:hypothetical protein